MYPPLSIRASATSNPPDQARAQIKLTSIPNLRLYSLSLDTDGSRCEFDSDSRFRFEVEFVARESRENYW